MIFPEGTHTYFSDLKVGDKLQYMDIPDFAPPMTSQVMKVLMILDSEGTQWIWYDYDEGRNPVKSTYSMNYFVQEPAA